MLSEIKKNAAPAQLGSRMKSLFESRWHHFAHVAEMPKKTTKGMEV